MITLTHHNLRIFATIPHLESMFQFVMEEMILYYLTTKLITAL
jgi:hypothetical protein